MSNPTMLVARSVRKVPEPQDSSTASPLKALSEFRSVPAWVLLGEPGAGKSAALKMEALETGGLNLSIDKFINDDAGNHLRGKTLFLDGLDEVRASGSGDSTLARLRKQLKRLGNPPFRIACRAADWYGSTDKDDLKSVSPDGQLDVLLLEPLDEKDILAILRANHGIDPPQTFVSEARQRGIADLLDNPQTLGLLAQAIRGDRWPATRDDTYRLACEKLATEPSKRHRDRKRNQLQTVEKVLDAAGQLCAVLLLSDKTGVALDQGRADKRFPSLADFSPLNMEAASQALGSKLFRAESEERMTPIHRSIAEYLGARWLARRIDIEGLPLSRVSNLMLGRDDRAVAGLRGLYGWLALHCQTARTRLIDSDPLTVIIYGDVKPMSIADKRRILAGLRREAAGFTGFHKDAQTRHPFGALASSDLREDFRAILESPARDDASQAFVDCVLDILAHGDALPELAPAVLTLVRDDTRWSAVRRNALTVWLSLNDRPENMVSLLDEVADNRVADPDDELTGMLLGWLYPGQLSPEALFRHLHKQKNPHLTGIYAFFWIHKLPDAAPDEHLPRLLDALVGREEISSNDPYERRLGAMADQLLARGLAVHGDRISDDRLFAWLGIGADKYGSIRRNEKAQQAIAQWLRERPERYKAVLGLCFQACEDHERLSYCVHSRARRLHHAAIPADLGRWHLEQASLTANQVLAQLHLAESASALANQRGAAGLSLDDLVSWGDAHPDRKHWLVPLLTWDVPAWQTEMNAEQAEHKQNESAEKRDRTRWLTPFLPEIPKGAAPPPVMHQLAGVWMNHFSNIQGETPSERFDSFCENGQAVFEAARNGFKRYLARTDLPGVDEIILLGAKSREHFVRLPCLVGMELLWKDNPEKTDDLSQDVLERMIAFRLTYGIGNAPAWFTYVVQKSPAVVAEVLIEYASTTLRAGQDFVDGIYPLDHDAAYRALATIAAPRLLELFPLRARSGQLNHLEHLLKAALRYTPKNLKTLVKKKTAMKGIDVAQKVYWHVVGALLDPKSNEAALWRYVGKSEARTHYLSSFLGERFIGSNGEYEFSTGSIGKLIELLAPHAEVDWPRGGGSVTDSMRRGDQVHNLIAHLGAMATSNAQSEIDRLLALPTLKKLKWHLESARHQLKLRQRETEFRFLSPQETAQVLANKSPASISDLAALTLDHLDDIAREIRQDNDDGFRAFWNVKNKKPLSQRDENLCRDALLTRLRARLQPLGIDSQPEGDYFDDKRADLRLSYRSDFDLPIEIKRDTREDLWTALRKQLIEQYAVAPRAYGYGIYLVFWFGGKGMPPATDGGKKPRSAEELRIRLEAQLDSSERQRIFVRVFDVSWPTEI